MILQTGADHPDPVVQHRQHRLRPGRPGEVALERRCPRPVRDVARVGASHVLDARADRASPDSRRGRGRSARAGSRRSALARVDSPLLRYILRRLAWSLLLLVLVSFLTFLVFYVLPSTDPAVLRAGRNATPEQIAEVRAKLGLDQPFYEQFWIYAKDVVTDFDLGYSYYAEVPVRDEILARLPASISVALGAFVLWMLIALPVGVLTALKPRSKTDRVVTGTTLFFLSAPTYWLGLVALFLFAQDIGRFPLVGGAGTYVPLSEDARAWFESLIWPWIVLALAFAGLYARLIGESLREAMAQDYVRTARAKGLRERRVVLRHGLRAALTPVITLAALDLGLLLGGTILVETVFNIPASGAMPSRRSRTATCPRSRASSCSARSSSCSRSWWLTSSTRCSTLAFGTDRAAPGGTQSPGRLPDTRGRRPRGERRLVLARAGANRRARGRVGLREDGDRPHRPRADPLQGHRGLGPDPARRRRSPDALRRGAARRSRAARRDGLPGPAVVTPSRCTASAGRSPRRSGHIDG